jgi:hypothetical protein
MRPLTLGSLPPSAPPRPPPHPPRWCFRLNCLPAPPLPPPPKGRQLPRAAPHAERRAGARAAAAARWAGARVCWLLPGGPRGLVAGRVSRLLACQTATAAQLAPAPPPPGSPDWEGEIPSAPATGWSELLQVRAAVWAAGQCRAVHALVGGPLSRQAPSLPSPLTTAPERCHRPPSAPAPRSAGPRPPPTAHRFPPSCRASRTWRAPTRPPSAAQRPRGPEQAGPCRPTAAGQQPQGRHAPRGRRTLGGGAASRRPHSQARAPPSGERGQQACTLPAPRGSWSGRRLCYAPGSPYLLGRRPVSQPPC